MDGTEFWEQKPQTPGTGTLCKAGMLSAAVLLDPWSRMISHAATRGGRFIFLPLALPCSLPKVGLGLRVVFVLTLLFFSNLFPPPARFRVWDSRFRV